MGTSAKLRKNLYVSLKLSTNGIPIINLSNKLSIKESIVELNSDSEENELDLFKRRDSMEEFNARGCNEIVM